MKNLTYSINLFNLRKSKNLTQQDVANALNISQQSYQKYEKSITEPSVDSLIKLSEFYNISIDEILGNEKYLKNEISIPNEKKETVQLLLNLPDYAFNIVKVYIDNVSTVNRVLWGTYGFKSKEN